MPEGPEVRVIADKLREILVSRYFLSCEILTGRGRVSNWDCLTFPVKIINVMARSKKIVFVLGNGLSIVTGLGMTGRYQYGPGNHSHLAFTVADALSTKPILLLKECCKIYYDDMRNFGTLEVIETSKTDSYFSSYGPDLLAAALKEETWISTEAWKKIFQAPRLAKRPLCKVLLDQDIIAGIGNYLKSEILYYSGLHPERPLGSLTEAELEILRVNSHKVINLSYQYGGLTIENFISPDGKPGIYPKAVYKKETDPQGNKVVTLKTSDGRASYWVPGVQV